VAEPPSSIAALAVDAYPAEAWPGGCGGASAEFAGARVPARGKGAAFSKRGKRILVPGRQIRGGLARPEGTSKPVDLNYLMRLV